MSPIFLAVLGLVLACGAPPEPYRKPDPYGPRIGNCIDAPRARSDSAHAAMMTFDAGLAVLGSTPAERAQARRDFGPGGDKRFGDEAKVRRAFVQAFRMDRTPVTNVQYAEFTEACGIAPPSDESLDESRWQALAERFGVGYPYAIVVRHLFHGRLPPPPREQHPVVLVTHDEAGFYCAWRGGRLPTEEEWERAARGPEGRIYPWGNAFDPFRVNTRRRGLLDTMPVGSLPQGATSEGMLDMGGHVYEWTDSPAPSPAGAYVVKGNGWDGLGGYGRGAARLAFAAELRNVNLGFRCAGDL